jgi:hypothetical protein
MGPTINALVAKATGKADAPSDDNTKALLEKWRGQNLIRAFIAGSATILGGAAILA